MLKIGSTDITSLADKINAYIQDFSDFFVLISVKLAEYGMFQNVEGILSGWTTNISELLQASVMSIANSVSRAGSWAINLVLGLTIAFYILEEKNKVIYCCKNIVNVFFSKKCIYHKRFLQIGDKYIFWLYYWTNDRCINYGDID